ncbi:MAG: hypothetical protein COV76_03910 [Candidatus Omnitrophica bacterium CG11_big_fil_rev_8_21_14_0_20_64_10]|nr:MAG: hypothetical protein COV76_03910 [Candidatus Omnitrophica bacterium CG11_big_fil_rev_8_21_14_0_20_64_10]
MRAGRLGIMGILGIGLATAGCGMGSLSSRPAAPPSHERLLPAGMDAGWEGALTILQEAPLRRADPKAGRIETDWIEGWSERSFGYMGLSHRRRARLTVTLTPAGKSIRVAVRAQVEEKPPLGAAGLRWKRIPSDGAAESGFLEALEQHLAATR